MEIKMFDFDGKLEIYLERNSSEYEIYLDAFDFEYETRDFKNTRCSPGYAGIIMNSTQARLFANALLKLADECDNANTNTSKDY